MKFFEKRHGPKERMKLSTEECRALARALVLHETKPESVVDERPTKLQPVVDKFIRDAQDRVPTALVYQSGRSNSFLEHFVVCLDEYTADLYTSVDDPEVAQLIAEADIMPRRRNFDPIAERELAIPLTARFREEIALGLLHHSPSSR